MRFRRRRKRLAPGEFPEHVTRAFVQRTMPSATPSEARRTVEHLRAAGWSEQQLADQVLPFMPPEAVTAAGAVALPDPVSRQWLEHELPAMSPRQLRLVVEELERRGWSPARAALAVLPHLLPKLAPDDARAIVADLPRLGLSDEQVARLGRRIG